MARNKGKKTTSTSQVGEQQEVSGTPAAAEPTMVSSVHPTLEKVDSLSSETEAHVNPDYIQFGRERIVPLEDIYARYNRIERMLFDELFYMLGRMSRAIFFAFAAIFQLVCYVMYLPFLIVAEVTLALYYLWKVLRGASIKHGISRMKFASRLGFGLCCLNAFGSLHVIFYPLRKPLYMTWRRLCARFLHLPAPKYYVRAIDNLWITLPRKAMSIATLYSPTTRPVMGVIGDLEDHREVCSLPSLPVILMRTPYGRHSVSMSATLLAERGYHVLVQDTRGRFDSSGEFFPVKHEQEDGAATIRWVNRQCWCDGNIGVTGVSYLGLTSWAAASARHPALKAIVPVMASSRMYPVLFPGGSDASSLDLVCRWLYLVLSFDWIPRFLALPIKTVLAPYILNSAYEHLVMADLDKLIIGKTVPYYQEGLMNSDRNSDFWADKDFLMNLKTDGPLPAIRLVGGWYDFFLHQQLHDYQDCVSSILNHTKGQDKDSSSPGDSDQMHEFKKCCAGTATATATATAVTSRAVNGTTDVSGADVSGADVSGADVAPLRHDVMQLTPQQVHELHDRVSLVVGPWAHWDIPSYLITQLRLSLEWFDLHLKKHDTVSKKHKSVRLFVYGRNQWCEYDSFPPAGETKSLYLTEARSLSEHEPAESDHESYSQYTYNPKNATPHLGGPSFNPFNAGRVDQRAIEARDDVLVFRTDPLDRARTLVGPVTATLYIDTDASSFDVGARLCEVKPNGVSLNICEGIIRVDTDLATLPPGVRKMDNGVYEVEVCLGGCANHIRRGHSMGLQVFSACYPRISRNLGLSSASTASSSGTHVSPSHQRVHHSTAHPSRITFHETASH